MLLPELIAICMGTGRDRCLKNRGKTRNKGFKEIISWQAGNVQNAAILPIRKHPRRNALHAGKNVFLLTTHAIPLIAILRVQTRGYKEAEQNGKSTYYICFKNRFNTKNS